MVVVQRLLHSVRDVSAATASTNSPVEPTNNVVSQRYVQSHGHTIAHWQGVTPAARQQPRRIRQPPLRRPGESPL